MDSLESPPTNFRSPNSIAESADEDSEIEFSEDLDDNLRPINLTHN